MILPRVQKETKHEGHIEFKEPIKVYCADYPGERAFSALKLFCPTVVFCGIAGRAGAEIVFECLPSITKDDEYYRIDAKKNRVTANYRAFAGARNAAASLAQLLAKTKDGYKIEKTEIEDWPDNKYRGLLIDPAYMGIIPIQAVKDIILRMGLSKYNILHLNLTSHTGYALKSEVYPEISLLAGYPEIEAGAGAQYTKAEMRGIIEYAEALGIEIMPEFDIPGHLTRLMADMPELMCVTKNEPPSRWAVCAGNEKTYEVLENIYTELAELFPGKYIHIGTDEVEMLEHTDIRPWGLKTWPSWHDCTRCGEMCAREGIENNRAEIFLYMLRRIYRVVSKLGKKVVLWNDNIVNSIVSELPRDMVVQLWLDSGGNVGPADGCSLQKLLEEGFEVINSYSSQTYIEAEMQNNDATIAIWDPKTIPAHDPNLSGQIIGGQPCAWGYYPNFAWSVPTSLMMFGDRLWNRTVCADTEAYGKAGTRHQLGIDTPEGLNIFEAFGGFMQPRSNEMRMWAEKAADDECLDEIDKILEKLEKGHLAEGRLAGEYRRSIAWLKKNRI